MTSSPIPTLQILMRVPMEHLSDSVDMYSRACTQVLEIAASSSKYVEYEDAIACVSRCLVSMVAPLNTNETVSV